MIPPLNESFSVVSKADWISQIGRELKDTQAYDSLRWATPEGFTLEPFYTADDWASLPLARLQEAQKAAPGWLNAPAYALEEAGSTTCRDALEAGADALVLDLSRLGASDASRLSRGLNGVKLSDTPVFFMTGEPAAAFLQTLQTIAPYQLNGGLLSPPDPTTAEATRRAADSPGFRTICLESHDFHQAGATATEELAFLMARLADVYDRLTEEGLTPAELAAKTLLSVSVGTSYFVEIAKLRALRVLWQRFMAAWDSAVAAPPAAFIHAQTSAFYESTATPYNNLLRATTEAMAAVLGGCDALTVRPYDQVSGGSSQLGERIARNVSLLLADESHLDKVADPSAGSYYIETLTHKLTENAWEMFLEIEAMGGLAKADDFVRSRLSQSFDAKIQAVRDGKVLVGVTKFRVEEPAGADSPVLPAGDTPPRRLASAFE